MDCSDMGGKAAWKRLREMGRQGCLEGRVEGGMVVGKVCSMSIVMEYIFVLGFEFSNN